MESEQVKEQQKLEEFLQVIEENLGELRERKAYVDKETKELYDAYMEGDTELYSSLMVSQNLQQHINHSLEANEGALDKPHFGRVDYLDREDGKEYSLYIGKRGIMKGSTEVVIMDWRAAAASIYYECGSGEGSYTTPEGGHIPIRLDVKRTYDIEKGRLLGFYDSDTAANDELLIKYLARNKDVVLGEIIATIQQEQNRIIRERHNRSMIIQGVAGSGKTTVAVHRISYILYNFSNKYAPSEIAIVGSNDILLNYIASGLPSLDVHNTRQYRMEKLLEYLVSPWLPRKYGLCPDTGCAALKSGIDFIHRIEEWTKAEEKRLIPVETVEEKGRVLLSHENIMQFLNLFSGRSIGAKIENLNGRLAAAIRRELDGEEAKLRRAVLKKYSKYFSSSYKKRSLQQLYVDFLLWLEPQAKESLSSVIASVQKGQFDVYDLTAMTALAYGWLEEKEDEQFGQLYIDEAQDYGAAVYYVLRRVMPKTVFMVMGDVSQNIHYESGMNDWKALREEVFCDPQDRFYTLCKSYRNTIEISEYAGRILEKSSFETYPIEPIIRHGSPVGLWREDKEEDRLARAGKLAAKLAGEDYQTIALICRDQAEAESLREKLGQQERITILPLALTKGLEFDGVILWNPNRERFEGSDKDAKQLYVAVTRALHELHIIYSGELCPLLQEGL